MIAWASFSGVATSALEWLLLMAAPARTRPTSPPAQLDSNEVVVAKAEVMRPPWTAMFSMAAPTAAWPARDPAPRPPLVEVTRG